MVCADEPRMAKPEIYKWRSKMKHDIAIPEGYAKVETLKGELIKRKANAAKVYRVVGYCREMKKYQLDDWSDISLCIYVKKGSLLFTAFEF